jgi:hypothetical protein
MSRKPQQFNGKLTGPRYVKKFVNGIWTIFDRLYFTNVEPNMGTEKNVDRVLKQ